MKYLALLAFIFTAQAHAQCFGPAGCNPDYAPPCFGPACATEPVGPAELCFPDGCTLVGYYFDSEDGYVTAKARLINGYAVRGDAGPCVVEFSECPNIAQQAFDDLLRNALTINRAQRY